MGIDKGETRRQTRPLEPLRPERPIPTLGAPFPGRREDKNKTLKQILDKLYDIERRLERIGKLLTKKHQRISKAQVEQELKQIARHLSGRVITQDTV